LTALPSPKTPTCNESLKKTHQRTAKAANDFWRRWEEYLLQLKSFHTLSPLKGKVVKVRVGDVLLHEDCRPRYMWKKAKVEELKVGRDGVPRIVPSEVRTDLLVFAPFSWSSPWRLTRVGRMWRNVFLNMSQNISATSSL
jgi:hypothetical protein